jgi:hypothetical protein
LPSHKPLTPPVCTLAPGNVTQHTLRELLSEMFVRIAECKEKPRKSRMSFLGGKASAPAWMPGPLMQRAVFQAACCAFPEDVDLQEQALRAARTATDPVGK